MNAVGIIFSNIHDDAIPEMTRMRTMASVPFGCRYRLIDFPLSNMVNSSIYNIGVITHYNYQSLMDHIGTGKDWDLARRKGGIKILPPYITAYDNTVKGGLYSTRLEALAGILNFITHVKEEYAILSDCDTICNLDINELLEYHIARDADITLVAKKAEIERELVGKQTILDCDENLTITDISEQTSNMYGERYIYMNMMVMKRTHLQEIVLDAIAHGYKSLWRDIMLKNIRKGKYSLFVHNGYHATVNSAADYFKCNMDLLKKDVRADLFCSQRPIYTKVRNSTPAKYAKDAKVVNSLIADGCDIEGTVENSIIFRGVKIGKGAVIKNSIIMQDTYCGAGAKLNCVITDKDVLIRDGVELSGHEKVPFFLAKGTRI